MHIKRKFALLGALTATVVGVACSDSGVSQPQPKLALFGSTGGDTGQTSTDPATQSLDPRHLVGVVHAIGAQPDTSKYELVAGATLVLSAPKDTAAGTGGQELGRAVSKSDGTFALGDFKPGGYVLTVIPPAGSSFVGTYFGFVIVPSAPATVSLDAWLGRK